MQSTRTNNTAGDARQQEVAQLGTIVAELHSNPDDTGPVSAALMSVIEIASYCPGGQQALIEGATASPFAHELLAFCTLFVTIMASKGVVIFNGLAAVTV